MTGTYLRRPRRPLAGLLAVSIAAAPWPASADQTLTCESDNYRYRYCRVDTDGRVELVDQISHAACRQGRSWGYDRGGVWVDQGCAARFRVGHHGGDRDKAIAGAVVGLAALAAIAASRHQEEPKEVAGWAVGTFSGYDEVEGTGVQLTVLPGGKVSGRAGSHEFSGSLEGDRLVAGRQVFRIQRQDRGFLAVDERNASHRVAFQRSGSGY